jgi:hypothetical protein
LEEFYNYLDTGMPELAMITFREFGKNIPKYLKQCRDLPNPEGTLLKELKDGYILWLEAQLHCSDILAKYDVNPTEQNLNEWRVSFRKAQDLQTQVGSLLLNIKTQNKE